MLYGYLLLKLRWSRLFISCFFTWRYFVCAFFFSFFFASTQATANFQTKIANKKKQNWTQAKIDDVLVFRYVSFITADQFSLFFSHSIPPSLSLFLSPAAARSLHRRFATEYFAFYYLSRSLSFSVYLFRHGWALRFATSRLDYNSFTDIFLCYE